MPAKVKVKIIAGRDLPIMDRASDLTDAFVEVKFAGVTHKTEVFRKSLNPHWNSEWYRFEVDDEDLQDQPLQLRVLDHDTYSAHNSIGKVYIDLNPLLLRDRASIITGWFPIYDTMHGIRGELHVTVKVDLFSDLNKFRQSSCGVQFFCTSAVPYGFRINAVHGFIEELVVNDDPEYQWIDKIRSQRASNEARQVQFSKLSGELQRKIGLKVLEMGGNSVIGYQQLFDLEGESGVVVRAIGTSVSLSKASLTVSSPPSISPVKENPLSDEVLVTPSSPSKSGISPGIKINMSHRSCDSESSTPPVDFHLSPRSLGLFAGSLTGSSGSGCGMVPFHRPVMPQQSIDILEFPFFTMKKYPPGFLVHLGGLVSSRSVKLLDRIHNPDEPETRDAWWMELRTEIRLHARALGCHAVIGYSEHTSICDEIIVLSACGTAAVVNLRPEAELIASQMSVLTQSLDRSSFEKEKKLHVDVNLANQVARHLSAPGADGCDSQMVQSCGLCHIPYSESSLPFPVVLKRCAICGRGKTPDVLFTTLEIPAEMPITGLGALVQARICRSKKDLKGEANAKEISDCLPFMEYELHNQLLSKLKIKGMNSLFGLKTQIVVGDKLLLAIATATGVYCSSLSPPPLPVVIGKLDGGDESDSSVKDIQRIIQNTVNRNRETFKLPHQVSIPLSEGSDDEELYEADLSHGSKNPFVLEIDDSEDAAVVLSLQDVPLPPHMYLCTTETMPGICSLICQLQMFTRVWRGQLTLVNNQALTYIFDNLFKSLLFKLRNTVPCALCHLDFDVEIHDDDDIQISVTGACLGVGEPSTLSNGLVDVVKSKLPADELIFKMEHEHTGEFGLYSRQLTKKEAKIKYHVPGGIKVGIELSPLSYIPEGRIDAYLGHLNFFIIRETTSVKESGGLNGFTHSFLAEVKAICRAHVIALGGNALVAFKLSECILDDNLHKNQSQCLINVSGDVVQVVYERDLNSMALQQKPLGTQITQVLNQHGISQL